MSATAFQWTPLRRERTRPTRRALLTGLLGVLLYGAGVNVSAGWVIVLASLLIGSLPWAWVSARRAASRLEAARDLPERPVGDSPARVRLALRGPTRAAAVVRDRLTAAAGAATELHAGTWLEADTLLRRGHAAGGRVEVVLSDLLGLVAATAAAEVPSEVEVVPAIAPVQGSHHAPWALEVGDEASRAGGGPEVLGVREYRHGDPVRAIHWRSTARRQRVVVRELVEEARPRVRVELAGGEWEQGALDRAAEAACGIADDASRSGHPAEVAVDGIVASWGPRARRHLALVPPHAGAPGRPLAPPAPSRATVTVRLAPAPGGIEVSVAARGADRTLGVLPEDLTAAEVGAWLSAHVQPQGGRPRSRVGAG